MLPCGRGTGGSGLRIVEPPDEEPRMRTSSRGDVASVAGTGASAALMKGIGVSARRGGKCKLCEGVNIEEQGDESCNRWLMDAIWARSAASALGHWSGFGVFHALLRRIKSVG